MNIKNDLKVIKEELNTQEQMIENFIKGERFFKKNKKILIAVFITLILILIGYYANKFIEKKRTETANEAYTKLLENSKDDNALKTLKDSDPILYSLFKFQNFVDNNDTNSIKALKNEQTDHTLKQIFAYAAGESSEIGAEYQTLMRGFLYLKQGKINEANAEFNKISLDSPLHNLVKNLQHFQGYKK